jgi:hypothetical protein
MVVPSLAVKSDTIRQVISSTKPPLNFYTSDGRMVYVDHPELVIVSPDLIAIGSGADAASGVVKEIVLLSPDHVVRVEPTKRKSLSRPG